ncbi:hypothetical protein Ae201684P_019216 [Aphanomyces euteiches]|nr:hypothetical protein Ae201684P_019216 [Aphanomyces euteiches]
MTLKASLPRGWDHGIFFDIIDCFVSCPFSAALTRQTRRFTAPSTSSSPSRTAVPVASATERITPRVASATPLRLLPLAAPTPGAHSRQAPLPPQSPPSSRRLRAPSCDEPLHVQPLPANAAAAPLALSPPAAPTTSPLAPCTVTTVATVFRLASRVFSCALCPVASFASWSALTSHRRSSHRHVAFCDQFVAACLCAQPFPTRLAAALHGRTCGPRRTPPPSRSPATAIPRRRTSAFGRATNVTIAPLTATLDAMAATSPARPSRSEILSSLVDFEQFTTLAYPTHNLCVWPATPLPAATPLAEAAATSPPGARHAPALLSPIRAPIVCPTCPRTFPSKRSLAQHARACPLSTAPSKSRRLGSSTGPDHAPPPVHVPLPPAPAAPLPAYVLRTDGSCRDNGNSTPATTPGGAGSVLFGPGDVVLWSAQHWLPCDATNNVAEYQALLNGLHGVLHWRLPSPRVECDSQLILSQVSGNARVSLPLLRTLRNKVLKALKHLRLQGTTTTLRHIPRNENKAADHLANAAMDTQSNDIVCFCADRSSRCVPSTMRATLSLPAPDEVWCLERSCFKPRVPPSPALSPASRRAIARARLRTPSPSRRPQPTTSQPVEALLMSATAPPLASSAPACSSAPTIDSSRSGEVLPVLLPPDDARQPLSSDSNATSSASANHSISRGEVLPDFVPAASTATPPATPIPSDPLASATAMLRDILDSSAEPQGHTTKQARLDLPPNLSEAAAESLERSLHQLGTSLILALDDTPSWDEAELLGPLAPPSEPRAPRQHRPPPVTRFQVEHTMESAQSSLSDLQRSSTATPRSIYRAWRKLGRLQKAWSRIQVRRMFVMDEKRCVDSIFRQAAGVTLKPSKCEIPLPTIADHFSAVNRPPTPFDAERPSGARFLEILRGLPPADFNANALSDDITMDDIEDALNHANLVSAPGLDGIPYRIYFRFRLALLPLLHTIFNRCWSTKRIPSSWKTSVTQLIFKKGDVSDVSNWRPLALQTTLYKLYASIVKARFSLWLESNERLSNSQKGFRSFNGCHEHNFLAQALLDTTRRSKSPFFAVWYDLRNAFGAMPHDFLWLVLRELGVASGFLDLLKDIYTDASTMVSASSGMTSPIQQLCGVFQGCPLSPLLFIAGMAPLINALDAQAQTHGVQIAPGLHMSTTAFADDIKIFSRTPHGIKALHDTVVVFLDWSTMMANPAKCAFLPVTYSDSRQTPSTLALDINGVPLPQLSLADSYAYLGVREGFDYTHTRVQLDSKLQAMRQQVTALIDSPLAPWQIIKALKVYVFSQLDYAIRHGKAPLSQLKAFSTFVTKSLRHLLRLPSTATNEFFYSPPSSGGLGLLPLDEFRDASVLAHAFQMLHDDNIQQLAREQLRAVIRKRYIVDPSALLDGGDLLLLRFLNGKLQDHPIASLKTRHADITSIWTDVQAALRRYNLKLRAGLSLRLPHMIKDVTSKNVARELKMHIKLAHAEAWSVMKDHSTPPRPRGQQVSPFWKLPLGCRLPLCCLCPAEPSRHALCSQTPSPASKQLLSPLW